MTDFSAAQKDTESHEHLMSGWILLDFKKTKTKQKSTRNNINKTG